MKNIETGDIILLNRHGKEQNFYSVAQRFFTKMPFTHTAIITNKFNNIRSVLSADELVVLRPLQKYFEEEGTDITIYSVNIDKNIKQKVIKELYYNYTGNFYGFLQILWFIYRWFMESVFRKDVRKQKNIFTSGEICSELVWIYLDKISKDNKKLQNKLHEWNQNTVHAGDISTICKSFPDIFIEKYKNF